MVNNGLPPIPIHPGEFLRETLDGLGLTQAAFADALGVSPMRVSHLLKGDRPVTAELALRPLSPNPSPTPGRGELDCTLTPSPLMGAGWGEGEFGI